MRDDRRDPPGPPTPPPSDARTVARYYAIQAVRLAGAGLALVALLMIGGTIEASPIIAYPLFLVSLAAFFLAPRALARKWKSDRE